MRPCWRKRRSWSIRSRKILEGILAAIGDCNALVVRNTKITRQIMEAAPKLAVIGRHGVGYDTVDIAACRRSGIPIVYTPAANTESVVEISIGFIICLGRKIVEAHASMQSEELLSDTVTMAIMTRQKGLINADLWGKPWVWSGSAESVPPYPAE